MAGAQMRRLVALLILNFGCDPPGTAASQSKSAAVVPYLYGRTRADAEATVRAAGLLPQFRGAAVAGSIVSEQSRLPGAQVARSSWITMILKARPTQATVPALLGLNRRDAESSARAAGLLPTFSGPDGQNMKVVRQSLPPAAKVARSTAITLLTGTFH